MLVAPSAPLLRRKRDLETIDSELRLAAALGRAARKQGRPLPSIKAADALLDERWSLTRSLRISRNLERRSVAVRLNVLTTAAKFEVTKDISGKFRFHLKAANGEIIASGQGYKIKASAEKGVEAVKASAPAAKVLDLTAQEAAHN